MEEPTIVKRERLKMMATQIVQLSKAEKAVEVELAKGYLELLTELEHVKKRAKRYQDALSAYAGGMARLGFEFERVL